MITIPDTLSDASFGLAFDEPSHTYHFFGERLDSVTQVVKGYSTPFIPMDHAPRVAAREGVTTEEILARWDSKRNESCVQGDYVHAQAEDIAWEIQRERSFRSRWGGAFPKKTLGLVRWFADHMEVAQGFLAPEFKVTHPEYRLAGTVDLIASNYEGVPSIIDWKTNESIDWAGYRNMLPPFQRGKLKLQDSNYWHYALQMSLYARVLRDCYDYDAQRLVLVHLPGDGSYDEYPITELTEHVDKILEGRGDVPG